MNLTYDPHQFPAVLRALADDLEALPGVELADTWLNVSLQVDSYTGTGADEDARIATVDRLAGCLGVHAEVAQRVRHYRTGTHSRHGAQITVFTALDDADDAEGVS